MRDFLLRDEVDRLLREGVRWRIDHCAGGQSAGVGIDGFPAAILAEVPNMAQRRKLQRAGSGGRRTYAFAELVEQDGHQVLVIDEGKVRFSKARSEAARTVRA